MTAKNTVVQTLYQEALENHKTGRLSEAKTMYEKVLAKAPAHAHANHLLGLVEHQLGDNEAAERMITKAIALHGGDASFYNNLSVVLQGLGRTEEAVKNCRRALAIEPDNFKAHVNLGNYLRELGHIPEAGGCYKKAIFLQPDNAEVHNNMGIVLTDLGYVDHAVASFTKALSIKPDYAEAHRNLGNTFLEHGFVSKAIDCFGKALAIRPDFASAQNNLGIALKDRGCLSEAIACYRKALAIRPDYPLAHSNLIGVLNFVPDITQDEIYNESLLWGKKHGQRPTAAEPVYGNTLQTRRRLKIGYLSPDFCSHSVASFFEPLLTAHNRKAVEIFCYANVMRADFVTNRMKSAADHWCSIAGMSDVKVAARVRRDRIDILVDLAGHTAKNRLLVFAHKPAPIQVSWLGYPNTTGLRTVDYRLTDAIADPAGEADRLHSEKLIRLEHGFLCYHAEASAPEVCPLPCQEQDRITFGSFNNLTKVSSEVVKVWAEILRALPDSRLLLKSKQLADEQTRLRYLEMFGKHGVTAERIELFGWLPKKEIHFGLYHKVDIALDPFPYNGTTTTCEALWMGVPVVTLCGERHAGRVGASIMHRIGLQELVAHSGGEYVAIAQALASDLKRLLILRSGLRDRMQGSELMDSKLFTESLENAYRQMWLRFIDKNQ